jgi:dTDP-4-amino-4,6-dideoxygalactose transaminase
VFVDVRDDYNLDPDLIEDAITPHTKAIIPVHLTGRPADMHPILEVAHRHDLYVIEDCAQAIGAHYHGQKVGSFGIAGCFSLHPLKTLNAAGDGGVITTDDPGLNNKLRKARNHGLRNRDECEFWSYNCRLDTIQAAMLLIKMDYLDQWTEARRANAAFYQEHLGSVVQIPEDKPHEYAVYHTFIVQAERRSELQAYLRAHRVDSKVHYPIPIHLQDAARGLGYGPGSFPVTERQARHILSLPVYPELTDDQLRRVVSSIKGFYG